MLKLYAIPISLYCAKLRIVLRHKGLEWEEVPPLGGYGSEEYKALVPAGNLPALDHDGLVLGDSEAIAEYINEIFPKPDMLPGNAGEKAQIRARARFHDTRLEPAVRALFAHLKKPQREDAFVADQWSLIQQRLDQLRPLLLEHPTVLTLGDCGFPITCTWVAELTTHFGQSPILKDQVQTYLQSLNSFDAVTTELAEYQPRLVNWLSEQ